MTHDEWMAHQRNQRIAQNETRLAKKRTVEGDFMEGIGMLAMVGLMIAGIGAVVLLALFLFVAFVKMYWIAA